MKKTMTRRCKLAVAAALLSGGLFHYASAYAALLDIARVPLFIGSVGVPPNIFITLDDSGSMDWEFTTNFFWQDYNYDWDVRQTQIANSADRVSGTQKRWWGFGDNNTDYDMSNGPNGDTFSYYYPNTDNVYGVTCTGGGNGAALFSCNTNYTLFRPNPNRTAPNADNILWDWRMFSSKLNVLYYNPNATYKPWVGIGTDASYTSARSNPKTGTNGYNVTRNLSNTDFYYAVWTDDKGFNTADPTPRGGNLINLTAGGNNLIDLWDTYTLYTVKSGAGNTVEIKTFNTTFCPTVAPFPSITTKPRCYQNGNYISGRLLVDQVGATTTLTGTSAHAQLGGRTIPEVKQNIANWYQYYRRRSFVAKSALAQVITDFPNFRYGISVLNQWVGGVPHSLFVNMPNQAQPPFDTHNNNLIDNMYKYDWDAQGTPLQEALDRSGKFFKGELGNIQSPIVSAAQGGECQQNFSLLTSDGFWNQTYNAIGDKDGDGKSNTLADVAYYYYKTDLSPLDNKVFTTPFDYADWQHMVTFAVGFGVEGYFNYPTASGWPNEVNPLKEDGNWGNPGESDSSPAKIDDMWHAAYNGRGAFFSARNPDELVSGLSSALNIVLSRVGSATALSLTAGFVTNNNTSTAYIARFNSADWTGQLLAVNIQRNGAFDTGNPPWDTSQPASTFATTLPANRKIFTYNAAGAGGVEFKWPLLDPTQQAALNQNPVTNLPDGKGQERLNFLRGKGVAPADSAWLTANQFRARSSMLGDIINSDPFFVDGVVYVGGNDGMLHAFDTANGAELFAYIPKAVFNRLNALPDKNYAHNYTVDGSAVVKEINGRKILVGALRAGGQAVYALDVTNPGSFSASDVLWEYSDADLGYTFSKPTIIQMKNNDFGVIIGNGYNNTEADGSASATGNAVLYILNAETGALLKKIDTGKGLATSPNSKPNGLATPAVVFDPDDHSKAKLVFAGDLQGNLWKFDVSAGSAASWDVAYSGKALFTATDLNGNVQPITIRPEVDLHPFRGYLVYFGTGKYLETTDNSSSGQPTQTLYAIWDRAWGEEPGDPAPGLLVPQTRAQLLKQEIIANVNGSYVTSKNLITWHAPMDSNPTGTPPAGHVGWYIDLIFGGNNRGEKQVTNGLLRDGKIIFNTTIPSAGLCDAGGSSNTIILDSISGGRLNSSAFEGIPDVDHDNDPNTPNVPVSSSPSGNAGILSEPKVVQNLNTGDEYIVSLSSSGAPTSVQIDPTQRTFGRQFWRQLPQQ